uniref:Sulfotransferase n=1 Tax=Leersia perrieri TaxID=77586 RepID=A0A0D9VJK3_9ORYZ
MGSTGHDDMSIGADAGDGEDWPNALAKYEALASSLPSCHGLGSTPYRSDVILATMPKSGTTWLKALTFCVVHRGRHPPADHGAASTRHPLLRTSQHDLVPFLHSLYESTPSSPRPGSVTTPFAEAFERLCDGVSPFGPMWDHAAEYWSESVARPREVMFLRYESLKEDGASSVRRLAGFLGCPFTGEEVARGVPEAIVELCSMERMRRVEANRDGEHGTALWKFKNSAFFRKGEVGDWKEHMTPEMARRLDGVVEEKLRGSGRSLIRR